MKSRTSRIALTLAAAAMSATPLLPLARAENLPGLLNPGEAEKPFESASVKYLPGKDRSVIETPCYRLVDDKGRHLELTGAVHVAERSYYEALNEHFKSFDAVLFECVADDDKIKLLQTGGRKGDDEAELSKVYRLLAHELLSMETQTDVVDYTRPNFVHADLGNKEFDALLALKGLTQDSLLVGGDAKLSSKDIASMLPTLKALLPKNDPDAAKRMMGPLVAHMESPDERGTLEHEVLITDRNQRALEVLDRELASGKRNLSIFYGSEHLPDFLTALHSKGWKDDGVEWRDAWIVGPKPAAATQTADGLAKMEEAKPVADTPENAAAAAALLAKAEAPFKQGEAVRFTTAMRLKGNVLGQEISQGTTSEVIAMKPNLLVVHSKNLEGSAGTLISDGKTVTVFQDGAKTYRQIPAPAHFGAFRDLKGLEPAALDDSNDVFGYLAMGEQGADAEDALATNPKLLMPATLNGAEHDRVGIALDGSPAVLWLNRTAFPLERIDIDATKMIEQQLGAEGAGLKDAMKLAVWVEFSEASVVKSFPDETFHFVPAEGMTKE